MHIISQNNHTNRIRRLALISILSILASGSFFGCQDDNGGIKIQEPDKNSCTSDDECKPGKCVENYCEACTGKECEPVVEDEIHYLEEGATCVPADTKNICKDPLICHQNVCKTKDQVIEDTDCQSDEDCSIGDADHQSCLSNGNCGKYLEEGDSCDPEDTKSQCKTPFICHQKTCKTEEQAKLDEQCHSDEDCVSQDANHQTCLSNNICGKYVNPGETCSSQGDSDKMCQDDYRCVTDICLKVLGENDPCDTSRPEICDPEKFLSCIANVGECHQIKRDLDKGEICNSKYLHCASDFFCYAQDKESPQITKCTLFVGEDDECDENDNIFCGDNLYCKEITETTTGSSVTKHICTPIGSTCSSSDECTEKDSYCCLSEDTCTEIEYQHCIPYDNVHTYDDMCLFRTKPGIFEAQIQCRWTPEEDDPYKLSKNMVTIPLVGKFGNAAGIDNVVAFATYYRDVYYSATDAVDNKGDACSYRNANYVNLNAQTDENMVLRIINPNDCTLLESFSYPGISRRTTNYPTSADLDNDGLMEIILNRTHVDPNNCYGTLGSEPAVLKWNDTLQKHEILWEGDPATAKGGVYPMVFDINEDGKPEIISGLSVWDKDGNVLYGHTSGITSDVAIGYLNGETSGNAYHIMSNRLRRWNATNNGWDILAVLSGAKTFSGFADFGTPGDTAEEFDFNTLDGKPEIVSAGGAGIVMHALVPTDDGKFTAQKVMDVTLLPAQEPDSNGNDITGKGGNITIADFDNDGYPEIGVASSGYYGVYDPRCTDYSEDHCADTNVLWERWSQDASSGRTGSTVFDFDGDGKVEVVYADECFTRVYDGENGRVLFSAWHSSGTVAEAPIVVDVDKDGSAEIIMGSESDQTCYGDGNTRVKNGLDPIHEGIRCEADEDCPNTADGSCNQTLGLCICQSDSDCNVKQIVNGFELKQYECAAPIHPKVGFMIKSDDPTVGRYMPVGRGERPEGYLSLPEDQQYKVCRATRNHPEEIQYGDVKIFRDRLDRWVSSRPIWNQHAYNIINIKDDGKVPTALEWANKFAEIIHANLNGTDVTLRKYNNYRLNEQGDYGAGKVPDITGRFIAGSVCGTKKDSDGNPILDKDGHEIHVISGKLCNRGTKPASSELPASFFYYDETKANKRGEKICTSYTGFIVEQGKCYIVGCELTNEAFEDLNNKNNNKKLLMVANLNENGNPTTVECNESNNTDTIEITSCDDNNIVPDNQIVYSTHKKATYHCTSLFFIKFQILLKESLNNRFIFEGATPPTALFSSPSTSSGVS